MHTTLSLHCDREEQELQAGAVLLAVVEQGKAGGASCPREGDLVSKVAEH